VVVTASTKESKALLAWVLVMPVSSAILAINSALFIVDFLKVLSATKIDGFFIQQNNFHHF
jgi:hypothetical protein